ncbi:MAG: hypothetical protein QXW10_04280 [Candidatus Micrarchaeaceae archaeon]
MATKTMHAMHKIECVPLRHDERKTIEGKPYIHMVVDDGNYSKIVNVFFSNDYAQTLYNAFKAVLDLSENSKLIGKITMRVSSDGNFPGIYACNLTPKGFTSDTLADIHGASGEILFYYGDTVSAAFSINRNNKEEILYIQSKILNAVKSALSAHNKEIQPTLDWYR